MDDRVRESQIERSWLQHQPERSRIPGSAWRALHCYKASIALDAKRIMAASAETPKLRALLLAAFRKGTLAKQKARAIQRLRDYLAPAVLMLTDDAMLWAWPEPRGSVIISDAPSDRQDCVVMLFGGASAAPRHDLCGYASGSVEVPDHALGRLLQRSVGADIGAALQEAHAAFLAANREIIAGHLKARRQYSVPKDMSSPAKAGDEETTPLRSRRKLCCMPSSIPPASRIAMAASCCWPRYSVSF
jgi:hypothetical protein